MNGKIFIEQLTGDKAMIRNMIHGGKEALLLTFFQGQLSPMDMFTKSNLKSF